MSVDRVECRHLQAGLRGAEHHDDVLGHVGQEDGEDVSRLCSESNQTGGEMSSEVPGLSKAVAVTSYSVNLQGQSHTDRLTED